MMSPLFLTTILIEILAGTELDLFVPSFLELQNEFQLSPFMVQLTISVNFSSYCLMTLISGTLGDRFDRRKIILISLVIFIFGSFLCCIAKTFSTLLLGRFLQGIGIAPPSMLAFVVITDRYTLDKQTEKLGILNGITTLGMAVAPLIGSYISIVFNWRGNFFVLLALGFTCIMFTYLFIPSNIGDKKVMFSLRSYKPLLLSREFMVLTLIICLLGISYWTFLTIAPILYMDGMGVELKHFGFYQGSLAGSFALVSLLTPRLLKKFGETRCMHCSLYLFAISITFLTLIMLFNVNNPILITSMMILFSFSAVFPINIFYPLALDVLNQSKSRASALITAIKLIGTACTVEIVSYFYNGSFMPLATVTLLMLTLGFTLTCLVITRQFFSVWIFR